jgi:hypothetical protein
MTRIHYGASGWLKYPCGRNGLRDKHVLSKSLDINRVTCLKCRSRKQAWLKQCERANQVKIDSVQAVELS